MSNPANEQWIASQLGVPQGEVEAAWHQARDDSGVRQNPNAGASTPDLQYQAAKMMTDIMNRGR